MVTIKCPDCKCEFGVPEALYNAVKCSEKIEFYCPYGHNCYYPDKERKNQQEEKQKTSTEQKREGNVILGLFKRKG